MKKLNDWARSSEKLLGCCHRFSGAWKDHEPLCPTVLDVIHISNCLLGLYLWPRYLAFRSLSIHMYKMKIALTSVFVAIKRDDAHKWLV